MFKWDQSRKVRTYLPIKGAGVVVVDVDGTLGSASGGSVAQCSSDTTLNLMSSSAIQRGMISPMSASMVIYKKIVILSSDKLL